MAIIIVKKKNPLFAAPDDESIQLSLADNCFIPLDAAAAAFRMRTGRGAGMEDLLIQTLVNVTVESDFTVGCLPRVAHRTGEQERLLRLGRRFIQFPFLGSRTLDGKQFV